MLTYLHYLALDVEPRAVEIGKGIILPLFLFIDLYYRTEFLYLHTAWGSTLLASVFGGQE